MGAKTALLAFSDGDLRPALLGATRSDPAEVEAFMRTMYPGRKVTPVGDGTLGRCAYPPTGVAYATVLAGAELMCDSRRVPARPSDLSAHLLDAGAGRRILLHGTHSGSDFLCFAVWDDGVLVRSLSMSPDTGIVENIGEPFDFEVPYWSGTHPVDDGDGEVENPYPFPFHPLDLGEEALRGLFGFVQEGQPDPDDVHPDEVHLHGFRII
jgi:hypothetical protein